MAWLIQFVASMSVSFGTVKPYFSSAIPLKEMIFSPKGVSEAVGEGVDVGGRDVGVTLGVDVSPAA
jgi:hypothetical protein